jgi:hypothetical protein
MMAKIARLHLVNRAVSVWYGRYTLFVTPIVEGESSVDGYARAARWAMEHGFTGTRIAS